MLVTVQNVENFEFGAATELPMHRNEFASVGPVAPGDASPR